MDDDSYRAGVMAERRRVILLALAHVKRGGGPSDDGHSLAHKVSEAGDYVPSPMDQTVERWSVFGERRLVREVPTFLECTESPFTEQGKRRVRHLEIVIESRGPLPHVRKKLIDRIEDQSDTISQLRKDLGDSPKEIEYLRSLVDDLRRQLSGVIS